MTPLRWKNLLGTVIASTTWFCVPCLTFPLSRFFRTTEHSDVTVHLVPGSSTGGLGEQTRVRAMYCDAARFAFRHYRMNLRNRISNAADGQTYSLPRRRRISHGLKLLDAHHSTGYNLVTDMRGTTRGFVLA